MNNFFTATVASIWFATVAVAAPISPKNELPKDVLSQHGEWSIQTPCDVWLTPLYGVRSLVALDDQRLLAATAQGVYLYDWPGTKPAGKKVLEISNAQLYRHGQRLLVHDGKVLLVYEIGKELKKQKVTIEDKKGLRVMAVVPGKDWVWYEAGDKQLTLYDLQKQTPLLGIGLELKPVAMAALGRLICISTSDGTIASGYLNKENQPTMMWSKRLARSSRVSLEYSADGRLLAVASQGRVVVYDALTGYIVQSFERGFQTGPFVQLKFLGNSTQLAASHLTPEPTVYVWDAISGEKKVELKNTMFGIESLVASNDGKKLTGAGLDGKILTWAIPPAKAWELPGTAAKAWLTLDVEDPKKAYLTSNQFYLSDGKENVKEIQRGVTEIVKEQENIRQWIKDLDSNVFKVRESAQKNITACGVRSILMIKDPGRPKLAAEGEERIKMILAEFERQKIATNDQGMYGNNLRFFRAARYLEWLHTADAKQALIEMISHQEMTELVKKEIEAILKHWGN